MRIDCFTLTYITDYDTNYHFVEHVLPIDTTFPTSRIHYRSLTNPMLLQARYGVITGLETVVSGCCLRGSWLCSTS